MRRDYGYFEEDQLGKPYDLKLLRRLFPFVRPYRLLFLLSIFLVTGITALDLALPYLTKVAIDEYIVQDTWEERPEASQESRLYVADLRRPEAERVVNQYPALFSIEWPYARIGYEDLPRLSKADLADLRQPDYAGVTRIALIFLGVILCHFIFSFGHVIIMEYAGQGIMHDLRLSLFKHIQGLSVAFFTRNPVGRLVTRMTSDVQNMHEFFTSIITVLFKDVFLVLGITVVLLIMDWQLALICFLMLPFIFVATTYFSRLARDVFRELRVKIAEINTKLQETIDGIRIVQLFLQEKKNYERFRQLNHENYLEGMRQINIFAVFMPAIEVLSSVTTALVIWYGGGRVVSEALSLGTLVAFISYMRMFFRPIRDIAEKYNIMQSAMASSERIFLLFDTREQIPEPEIPAGMPGKGASVSFENVWFSYLAGEWVLKDISLTVQHGETVAIVGPTGAGKSSLIHLLERFYDPAKGRITLDGVDIRQIPKTQLRAHTALITQDVFLFADTLQRNITQGNPILTHEHLQEIVMASNMERLVQSLPNGLDTALTEGGRTLSGGERQLVAFARALARDPEILILDEATSSVDTQTERLIQEATLRLMQDRTAIVVAHRLSTIRHADRIIVLHKGRIREIGTHDELIARQGLYYQLYQWQGVA
ncbi:MAG: ABC transporter ATP-binding protein [Deltaproteobacteria bacterium]|nr:ABC transporter ATP-binding protein [Deltaproteobacteria bacterium]